ncbi:hypothetical protein ACINWC743_A0593 [Acinetobacter sp. WC-743]|nr:hypothetical protein ACINWC743_A0593 [Acinetobacter sp. WC-743]
MLKSYISPQYTHLILKSVGVLNKNIPFSLNDDHSCQLD